MTLHSIRRGSGKPLLLVHGLGSSQAAWSLVMPALAERREVVAVDLAGHGKSPAEPDSGTFAGVVRSFDGWLDAEDLAGIDMVGSSLGARLVLEMARRGRTGACVALDPGGFWQGWERNFLSASLTASELLLRTLRSALPSISHNAAARTMLLPQLSAHPWAVDGDLVEAELTSFADTPTFNALAQDLAFGPLQEGRRRREQVPSRSGGEGTTGCASPCRRSAPGCVSGFAPRLVRAQRPLSDVGRARENDRTHLQCDG
jgi:pimeloyl-ACP methyl ester carboxylesterase